MISFSIYKLVLFMIFYHSNRKVTDTGLKVCEIEVDPRTKKVFLHNIVLCPDDWLKYCLIYITRNSPVNLLNNTIWAWSWPQHYLPNDPRGAMSIYISCNRPSLLNPRWRYKISIWPSSSSNQRWYKSIPTHSDMQKNLCLCTLFRTDIQVSE